MRQISGYETPKTVKEWRVFLDLMHSARWKENTEEFEARREIFREDLKDKISKIKMKRI